MSVDNVNDIEPRVQYVALAAQTAFDYTFPILADADLVVDVDGTTQALATDYTVTGAGDDTGGTVTFVSAMTGGETVTIYRDISIARTTDFAQNGPLAAASFNDELDKLTMLLQQMEAGLGRTLRFPMNSEVTSGQTLLSPVSSWKGKYVYFNATTGVPEPATAIATSTLSASTVGAVLYDRTAAEIAAGVTPTAYRYPTGDVRRYGATGDGTTDDTAAFSSAMTVAASSKQDVFVPAGSYRITSELGFPDQYVIRGEGRGSRILLDLAANSWCFKYSAGSSINSWGFQGLHFGLYSGASADVGAIGITSGTTLRGAILRDLYGDELHRVLLTGAVHGSLTIDNLSFKCSTSEADSGNAAIDLDSTGGSANAVYMSSIELLGRFRTGVKWSGNVLKIDGFNIAGSVTSTAELETAVHVLDGRNFVIRNGYVEKMVARSVAYEGLPTGNGSALSILVERSASSFADFHGIIENINLATGSVHIDGAITDVSLRNVDYAEANGGLRCVNGPVVEAFQSAIKVQTNDSGHVRIVDPDSARGLYSDPTLRVRHPFSVIGGASLSDETSDYVSGTRSIKVTPATTFEGVTAAFTLPKASQQVTVVAKVKAVTTGDVRLDATSNTSSDSSGVLGYITPTAGAWHVLTLTCSSSTTTLNVRLRNSLNDVFLIDSIQVYYGVASFDPSKEPDMWGASAPPTYTASNVVTDRAYDANATTTEELADVVGTLIADLRARGIVQ